MGIITPQTILERYPHISTSTDSQSASHHHVSLAPTANPVGEGDRTSGASYWSDRVSDYRRVLQQAYAAVRRATTASAALTGVEIFIAVFVINFTDFAKCAVRILGPSTKGEVVDCNG